MELSIREPKDIQELRKMIGRKASIPNDFDIMVEGNIFSVDGKWLLKNKKAANQNLEKELENIHGVIEPKDKKFVDGMERIILKDFPDGIHVTIKKFLYARLEESKTGTKPRIILSYLGVLEGGNRAKIEQDGDLAFNLYQLGKVGNKNLTEATKFAYRKIMENWKVIENILNTYKKFDQKYLEKYFFYGMENREVLLEGIIYFTNRSLTRKYLNIKHDEDLIPLEKQLENLKVQSVINYEQLYRFINKVEKDDKSFDFKLNKEEKEEIQETIVSKIKQLVDDNMFLFFRRGIFYDDRIHGDDPKSEERVRRIEGYGWVEEVYKVILQLNYMQTMDPIQYYRKWLQVKFSRLNLNFQYSEEKLEKLKNVMNEIIKEKMQLSDQNQQ